MTIKQLLIQEIDNTPNEVLEDILNFLKLRNTTSQLPMPSYQELLERIDYLEAIVGIRKGLEEFEQGQGIPFEQAFSSLEQKLNIPHVHDLYGDN